MAAEPAAEPKAQIARMPRERADLTSPARYGWEPEQVEAIKQTVARDCSPAEFVMFLELAARYQLDPFARQIWAAKMGEGHGVAVLVGRDGLQAIADRNETFDGMDSDVVVAGDKLIRDKETGEFVHEWGEDHLTGEIIGAWAMVWRSDRRKPTCFYARMSEYSKPNSKFWQRFKSAMIVKCAESMALKRAYSITGLLVEEEVSEFREHGTLTQAQQIEWGDDALGDYLKTLVEAANEAKRNSYRERKVLALLHGRDEAARRAFAQELIDHIRAHEGEVPDPPEDLIVNLRDGKLEWPPDEDVIEGEATDLPEPDPADPEF